MIDYFMKSILENQYSKFGCYLDLNIAGTRDELVIISVIYQNQKIDWD